MREARLAERAKKYKKTVLRVTFPADQVVLQATFEPFEKVADVIEFLRQFMIDSNLGFYIYTTPPRDVLQPGQTLFEKNLVPAAMVHVGAAVSGPLLKPEVRCKTTSFEAISAATRKLREQLHGIKPGEPQPSVGGAVGGNDEDQDTLTPTRPKAGEFRQSSVTQPSDGKVPKWFKFGK